MRRKKKEKEDNRKRQQLKIHEAKNHSLKVSNNFFFNSNWDL